MGTVASDRTSHRTRFVSLQYGLGRKFTSNGINRSFNEWQYGGTPPYQTICYSMVSEENSRHDEKVEGLNERQYGGMPPY